MSQTSILAAASLFVALLALVLAFAAHRRLAGTRRSLLVLQGSFEGKTLVDAVASYLREVRKIDEVLGILADRQNDLSARIASSARNMGVVRYDAFEEMGGQMSFSAAILDDHGDGIVFTSINGRTEARTYFKAIERSSSEHNLSPEEERAIAEAMNEVTRSRRWR